MPASLHPVAFSGNGAVLFRGVLEGASFGSAVVARGRRSFPVSGETVVDRGVTFQRGDVREELVLRPDGYEQRWHLDARPSGSGPLVVTISTGALVPAGTGEEGLRFLGPDGKSLVTYGHGTWIDGAGARTAIPAELVAGSIRLTVPASVVERTAYPAVLDPVVSVAMTLDPPTPVQTPLGWIGPHATGALTVLHAFGPQGGDRNFCVTIDANGVAASPIRVLPGAPSAALWTGASYLLFIGNGTVSVGEDGSMSETVPLSFAPAGTVQSVSRLGPEAFVLVDGAIHRFDLATRQLGVVIATPGFGQQLHATPDRFYVAGSTTVGLEAAAFATDGTELWRHVLGRHDSRAADNWSAVALGDSVASPAGLFVLATTSGLLVDWRSAGGFSRVVSSDGVLGPVQDGPRFSIDAGLVSDDRRSCVLDGAVVRCAESVPSYYSSVPGLPIELGSYAVETGARLGSVRVGYTNPATLLGLLGGRAIVERAHGAGASSGGGVPATWTPLPKVPLFPVPISADAHAGRHFVSTYDAPMSDSRLVWIAANGTVGTATPYSGRGDANVRAVGDFFFASAFAQGVSRFDAAGTLLPVTWSQSAFGSSCILLSGGDDTGFGIARFSASDARRFRPDGTVLDPQGLALGFPADAAAFTGRDFLVVGRQTVLKARRIPATGAVTTPIVDLSATAAASPRISCGFLGCLVTWVEGTAGRWARLTYDGAVVSSGALPAGSYSRASLVFDGTHYVLASDVGVVGARDVVAIRISEDGTLVDAAPFDIAATALDEYGPVLSSAQDGVVLVSYARETSPRRLPETVGRWLGTAVVASTCASPADCASGFCVDGFCCDAACGGNDGGDCLACSVAAGGRRDGRCGVARQGTTCRPLRTSECDVAEQCTGLDVVCPGETAIGEGAACDDGQRCTLTDRCVDATCVGTAIACPAETCRSAGSCDPGTGACVRAPLPDGTGCEDGNPCTLAGSCVAGACQGSEPVVCTRLSQCHQAGVCDPASGSCSNPELILTTCDDGNLCTTGDRCFRGACNGSARSCPAPACHTAACDRATGECRNTPVADRSSCDDGLRCTGPDQCQGGVCGSTPTCRPRPGAGACEEVVGCAEQSGDCVYSTKPNGTPCEDGSRCTSGDVCTGSSCAGTPTCVAAGPCFTARCDEATGACEQVPRTGVSCDDGNACTTGDRCSGTGLCAGTDRLCPSSPCLGGACDPLTGACTVVAAPDGTTCDDADRCTTNDGCVSGACVGVVRACAALDDCHFAGRCDPRTGQCTNPVAPNDTACDDGNACTRVDRCDAGACRGSAPVNCVASDGCHAAGVCEPASGACSNPVLPDGTTCEDGSACSHADTCQAGRCIAGDPVVCVARDACHLAGACDPSTGACSEPPAPQGSACDDGDACTTVDTCVGGTCVGAAPVTCALPGPCETAGSCDPRTGACVRQVLPTGTECDDGNGCTQGESCLEAVCGQGTPRVCTPPNPCLVSIGCDASTGDCLSGPREDGASCDDGNGCTTRDACLAGACAGAAPIVCAPPDACHAAGQCDPDTGSCSAPALPDGASCDDGNGCTTHDGCVAGACTGAAPIVCAPLDACHAAGECDPATGACSTPALPDGAACDDGNPCTQRDECFAGACTGAAPIACAPLDACHAAGQCDPATGTCSMPALPDGASCDDGNACTTRDECFAGACAGAAPIVCASHDACRAAQCDPATGTCSATALPDGAPCDDGSACTQGDACVSGGCVPGEAITCTGAGACLLGRCAPELGACVLSAALDGTPCEGGACVDGVCEALGGADAGPVEDAGPAADAGEGARADAGAPADEREGPDGGAIVRDAGTLGGPDAADAGEDSLDLVGCGCGGGRTPDVTLLWAVLGLTGGRRRRANAG